MTLRFDLPERAHSPAAIVAPAQAAGSGSSGRVGILAGWGRYPLVVAEGMRRQGFKVYCLGVKDHADPALAHLCDDFEWVGLARLGRAIRYFRRHGVDNITMVGKIHKYLLFQRWAWVKHLPAQQLCALLHATSHEPQVASLFKSKPLTGLPSQS